jgi:outer membrane autotransporter protein
VQNDSTGLIQSTRGLAIRGGAGNDVVENHGWLVGGNGTAVDLDNGDDVLHLTTTSAIEGRLEGGAGFDALVLAGTGRARTDLGRYGGFEALNKQDAGSWMLTGSANLPWLISGGELAVEGALEAGRTVQAAGRLSGNGYVDGIVNEGTVAPGASIGTLTVHGDYRHAGTGVLEIESLNATDVSDRLVVGGSASLDGGSVASVAGPEPYGIATEYTILTAGGGVTGRFAGATSSAAYLDPFLDYTANAVSLTLIRNDISFRAMGNTENAQAFGAAMDANKKAMARADFKGVMDTFDFMNESDRAAALDALTGEVHATTPRALLRIGNRFFSAVTDRQLSARQLTDETKTFWADAFGFSGSVDADGNASRADYRAAGFATGVDVMLTDNTRAGIGVGFAPGRMELNRAGAGTATSQSLNPTIYAVHDAGRWDFGGAFGYSAHDVSTTRTIHFATVARRAESDYTADQYSGMIQGAFELRRVSDTSLKAFGELYYSRLTRGAFTENGAGSAGLADVAPAESDSLRTVLGVRTSWAPTAWRQRLTPRLKVGWIRESLDDRGSLSAGLTGARTSDGFQRFTIFGTTESRNSMLLNLGAATGFGKNGDAFFLYDGLFAPAGFEHGLAAGVRVSW